MHTLTYLSFFSHFTPPPHLPPQALAGYCQHEIGGNAALCPAGDVCPYGCIDQDIATAVAIASAPDSPSSIAEHNPTALAAARHPARAGSLPTARVASKMIKGQALSRLKSSVLPRASIKLAELAGIRPGMAVMAPCPDNTDSPPGATDYTACEVGWGCRLCFARAAVQFLTRCP